MSTRRFLVTAVAIATLVIPTVAHGATIRVTSAKQPLLGNLEWSSGSARAFLADDGTPRALKANTALGQLVAATAFTGTALDVGEFAGLGVYVEAIGGEKVGPKGAWMFYVNGRAAQVGADSQVLRGSDEVIWWLDTDYGKKDPVILDLSAKTQADGTVLFTARKADGKGFKAAKGATIVIDGAKAGTTNAKGQLRVTPAGDWDAAHAELAGAIDSQIVDEPMGS